MEEKPISLELRPPPPPDALLPSTQPPMWAMVSLGIAALLVVLAIMLLLRRWMQPRLGASVRKRAYREAVEELDGARPLAAREAATMASLVLRRYLTIVSRDPALFETHEEFIGRQNGLAVLPEVARAATVAEFGRLAALKYGKDTHAGDAAPVLASARALLETLDHSLVA